MQLWGHHEALLWEEAAVVPANGLAHTTSMSLLSDTSNSGTHIFGLLAEVHNSRRAVPSDCKHGKTFT
jgi:hypothetical protein